MSNNLKTWQKVVMGAGAVALVGGGAWAVVYTIKNGEPMTVTSSGVSATKLTGDAETITLTDGENLISKAGIYHVTGSITGYIHVNAGDKDEVKIILDNVSITNNSGPAIYVESNGNTYIELVGENTINATTDDTLKGAIHSKADLLISGDGTVNIKSSIHGIVCKDDLEIDGGTFVISAGDDGINTNDSAVFKGGTFKISATGDGIHTDGYFEIDGGAFDITAREGLEGTEVKINDGTITISASDDGINAGNKSSEYTVQVTINGGTITITMGAGDTDGIDSNGNLYINGGTITITGQSPFDYDGEAKYTGGKMIINGVETTEITNQFMGGGFGGQMGPQQSSGQQVDPRQNSGQQVDPRQSGGRQMTRQ
ncbi:carbohydrate-binding domain-containing protein [Candidatus Saccharibacteria bacterium]|nr:carbohydrate-binding domain-containing protein [Candidatus Saccharibacteria bacterium]